MDGFEQHPHRVTSPISETDARAKLATFTIEQLHEIANADGLQIVNRKREQINIILIAWFQPEGVAGHVLSFQELLDKAENLPQGERKVWRKKTHAKGLGEF